MRQNKSDSTKVLGITGQVGAGKSTVLSFLEQTYGARILRADDVGHRLMEPGMTCYEPVRQAFGDGILSPDGTVDRSRLGALVFGQKEQLRRLNAIIHPAVKEWIRAQLITERRSGRVPFVVVEAALLLEEGYGALCDEIWYVFVQDEVRRERLKSSRGYSDERIDAILRSQQRDEVFRASCPFVVDNSGDFEKNTRRQLERGLKEHGFVDIGIKEQETDVEKSRRSGMKRTIITVVGRDRVGIIAKVCTYLAEHNVNILDISQTIVQGFFNMMMITDANQADRPFDELAHGLEELGEGMGLTIRCQHEDIFDMMHRI